MKYSLFPLLLVALLTAPGCGASNGSTKEPPEGQSVKVSVGQGIFLNNCLACHRGGGNPPGPDSIIMNSSRLDAEADFNALLRNPTSPMMTPFTREILPDGDVHELYIYLQNVKDPSSTAQSHQKTYKKRH